MKIAGKQISGPNVETVIFPRADGDIVFRAQAVLDYTDFDALCPVPSPPVTMLPGGLKSEDRNDASYMEKMFEWADHKGTWMAIESLKATENLEWETVNPSEPSTWDNYKEELKQAGFTEADRVRVLQCVSSANGLSQDRIDEAMKRFLAVPAVILSE